MDTIEKKIQHYQKILAAYVRDLASERNKALGNDMNYQAVVDTVGNHFQLLRIGFKDARFLYNVLIHFDIHPETGNVWVQQNNTEIQLDIELAARGIPKSHLVLGFRSADMRAFSDFAVA